MKVELRHFQTCKGFSFFTSHILFFKKLVEDVFQQNNGVNQEREKTGVLKREIWDCLCGSVVKNLPSNPGEVVSIPGRGTKIPHARGQLSPACLNY